MILERNGYGSKFNAIKIFEDKYIIKKCLTNYGWKKMMNEMNFYQFLKDNFIPFNTPLIMEMNIEKKNIKMEFLKNHIELYKVFHTFNDRKKIHILQKIRDCLEILHSYNFIVSKEQYYNDLIMETKQKILYRYNEIKDIIKKYDHIKKVNGHELKTFENIIETINENVENRFKKLSRYEYCLIHGDCQFSNILIDPKNEDIKFIDPRGYYGNTKLFGIREYDMCKIYFALTGYDQFDNENLKELNIISDNIIVNINVIDDSFKNDKFITSILMSIWLSNSHIFKDDEIKCVTSYFTSMF